MPWAQPLGDFNLSLQLPTNKLILVEQLSYQKAIIQAPIGAFGADQIVLMEPAKELGTPKRTTFTVKSMLHKCLHLAHKIDLIIIHGVLKLRCQQFGTEFGDP